MDAEMAQLVCQSVVLINDPHTHASSLGHTYNTLQSQISKSTTTLVLSAGHTQIYQKGSSLPTFC